MGELAKRIRAKFPGQYDQLSDDDLEVRVLEKHGDKNPAYKLLADPKNAQAWEARQQEAIKQDEQAKIQEIQQSVSPMEHPLDTAGAFLKESFKHPIDTTLNLGAGLVKGGLQFGGNVLNDMFVKPATAMATADAVRRGSTGVADTDAVRQLQSQNRADAGPDGMYREAQEALSLGPQGIDSFTEKYGILPTKELRNPVSSTGGPPVTRSERALELQKLVDYQRNPNLEALVAGAPQAREFVEGANEYLSTPFMPGTTPEERVGKQAAHNVGAIAPILAGLAMHPTRMAAGLVGGSIGEKIGHAVGEKGTALDTALGLDEVAKRGGTTFGEALPGALGTTGMLAGFEGGMAGGKRIAQRIRPTGRVSRFLSEPRPNPANVSESGVTDAQNSSIANMAEEAARQLAEAEKARVAEVTGPDPMDPTKMVVVKPAEIAKPTPTAADIAERITRAMEEGTIPEQALPEGREPQNMLEKMQQEAAKRLRERRPQSDPEPEVNKPAAAQGRGAKGEPAKIGPFTIDEKGRISVRGVDLPAGEVVGGMLGASLLGPAGVPGGAWMGRVVGSRVGKQIQGKVAKRAAASQSKPVATEGTRDPAVDFVEAPGRSDTLRQSATTLDNIPELGSTPIERVAVTPQVPGSNAMSTSMGQMSIPMPKEMAAPTVAGAVKATAVDPTIVALLKQQYPRGRGTPVAEWEASIQEMARRVTDNATRPKGAPTPTPAVITPEERARFDAEVAAAKERMGAAGTGGKRPPAEPPAATPTAPKPTAPKGGGSIEQKFGEVVPAERERLRPKSVEEKFATQDERLTIEQMIQEAIKAEAKAKEHTEALKAGSHPSNKSGLKTAELTERPEYKQAMADFAAGRLRDSHGNLITNEKTARKVGYSMADRAATAEKTKTTQAAEPSLEDKLKASVAAAKGEKPAPPAAPEAPGAPRQTEEIPPVRQRQVVVLGGEHKGKLGTVVAQRKGTPSEHAGRGRRPNDYKVRLDDGTEVWENAMGLRNSTSAERAAGKKAAPAPQAPAKAPEKAPAAAPAAPQKAPEPPRAPEAQQSAPVAPEGAQGLSPSKQIRALLDAGEYEKAAEVARQHAPAASRDKADPKGRKIGDKVGNSIIVAFDSDGYAEVVSPTRRPTGGTGGQKDFGVERKEAPPSRREEAENRRNVAGRVAREMKFKAGEWDGLQWEVKDGTMRYRMERPDGRSFSGTISKDGATLTLGRIHAYGAGDSALAALRKFADQKGVKKIVVDSSNVSLGEAKGTSSTRIGQEWLAKLEARGEAKALGDGRYEILREKVLSDAEAAKAVAEKSKAGEGWVENPSPKEVASRWDEGKGDYSIEDKFEGLALKGPKSADRALLRTMTAGQPKDVSTTVSYTPPGIKKLKPGQTGPGIVEGTPRDPRTKTVHPEGELTMAEADALAVKNIKANQPISKGEFAVEVKGKVKQMTTDLPWLKEALVRDAETGDFIMETPAGTVRIRLKDKIAIDFEALEKSYSKEEIAAIKANPEAFEAKGVTQTIGGQELVSIVETGKLGHELTHVAAKHFATPREWAAFEKKYAGLGRREIGEKLARSYEALDARLRENPDWQPTNVAGKMLKKVYDFFHSAYRAFKPNEESFLREVRSGKVFKRAGQKDTGLVKDYAIGVAGGPRGSGSALGQMLKTAEGLRKGVKVGKGALYQKPEFNKPRLIPKESSPLGEAELRKGKVETEHTVATPGAVAPKDYSIETKKKTMEGIKKYNAKNKVFTPEQVAEYEAALDNVAAIVLENKDMLGFKALKGAKALKGNSDARYKKSLDFTTLCRRRYVLSDTIDAIQANIYKETGKVKILEAEDIIKIRSRLEELGHEVNCGPCYVESRRINISTAINKAMEGFVDAKKKSKTYGQTLRVDPKFHDRLTTQEGRDWLFENHPDQYNVFSRAFAGTQIKVPAGRAAYSGEILKMRQDMVDQMNQYSGMRSQSWSDFEVPHMLDKMQAVFDMAARKLKGHAYTKELSYVEVMKETGEAINMSLIPDGTGFDANGKLIFNDRESIRDMARARALRAKYDNVGFEAIGISDKHIAALLADEGVDYVIPYHSSGLSREYQHAGKMKGWQDYTDGAHWTDAKTGKAVGVEREIFVDEWRGDLKKLDQLCKERGVVPPFQQFRNLKGYEKLLVDRRIWNGKGQFIEQKPVQFKFDMDYINNMLRTYKGDHKQGLAVKDVVGEFAPKTMLSQMKDAATKSIKGETLELYRGGKEGRWFTEDKAHAGDYGDVKPASVAVKKPLRLEAWDSSSTLTATDVAELRKATGVNFPESHKDVLSISVGKYLQKPEVVKAMQDAGYDSVMIPEERAGGQYSNTWMVLDKPVDALAQMKDSAAKSVLTKDAEAFKSAVKSLPHGKQLPDSKYVHKAGLAGPLRSLVAGLQKEHGLGNEYNLIKFGRNDHTISFLEYADFETNPHPALSKAVSIDLKTGKVTTTDFSKRDNRPILHRKESFVPSDHPDYAKFKALSEAEAEAGLLGGKEGGSGFIGFQKQWDSLLASKGLKIKDHSLAKLGETPKGKVKWTEEEVVKNAGRTSIKRGASSHAKGILPDIQGKSVIDWGQGKYADDVKFFTGSGAKSVKGYDPNFQPEVPTGMADVVTNTFVGNVLPPGLRRRMWIDAMNHAKEKLFIAVRAENPEKVSMHKEPIYDGYIMGTAPADGSLGTRTFQKFYTGPMLVEELKSIFPNHEVTLGKVKGSGVVSAIVGRKNAAELYKDRGSRSLEYGFGRGTRQRHRN